MSGGELLLTERAKHGRASLPHFYIRRDGTVEQYRDTAYQADANYQANDPKCGITQCHLYPLGGMAKSANRGRCATPGAGRCADTPA